MKYKDMIQHHQRLIELHSKASDPEQELRLRNLVDKIGLRLVDAKAAHELAEANKRRLRNEKRMDNLKARVAKTGMTFDEWLAWAKSLYDITSEFTVVSRAANWSVDMSWDHKEYIDALEKVEQLVRYKDYDRQRGRGSYIADLSK